MRKCAFCGAEVTFEFPSLIYLEDMDTWTFMHHCNNHRSILITAKTKDEVIANWNGDIDV